MQHNPTSGFFRPSTCVQACCVFWKSNDLITNCRYLKMNYRCYKKPRTIKFTCSAITGIIPVELFSVKASTKGTTRNLTDYTEFASKNWLVHSWYSILLSICKHKHDKQCIFLLGVVSEPRVMNCCAFISDKKRKNLLLHAENLIP